MSITNDNVVIGKPGWQGHVDEKGVKFMQEPSEADWGTAAVFEDLKVTF